MSFKTFTEKNEETKLESLHIIPDNYIINQVFDCLRSVALGYKIRVQNKHYHHKSDT